MAISLAAFILEHRHLPFYPVTLQTLDHLDATLPPGYRDTFLLSGQSII